MSGEGRKRSSWVRGGKGRLSDKKRSVDEFLSREKERLARELYPPGREKSCGERNRETVRGREFGAGISR